MKDYLGRQEDFAVTGIAYNGLEALEMIDQNNPDVIILDIIMPHLDGIGVLEKLFVGMMKQTEERIIGKID